MSAISSLESLNAWVTPQFRSEPAARFVGNAETDEFNLREPNS